MRCPEAKEDAARKEKKGKRGWRGHLLNVAVGAVCALLTIKLVEVDGAVPPRAN